MLSFIGTSKSGNSSPSKLPLKSESTTVAKLYDSISTLTLDRFIKCAVDGDLHQLQIDPTEPCSGDILLKTWEPIYEAFLDGMKDSDGLYKIRLIGKINHLQFNYEHIQLCVKFLQMAYHPDIVAILQSYMRVGEFNVEDMESYYRDLQVVLTRAQKIQQQIQEKRAELSVIQKSNSPEEKTTRKQFDQLIASVSIYAKFHIDKRIITVSEFIEYYTSRRENYEALEAEYDKMKR